MITVILVCEDRDGRKAVLRAESEIAWTPLEAEDVDEVMPEFKIAKICNIQISTDKWHQYMWAPDGITVEETLI